MKNSMILRWRKVPRIVLLAPLGVSALALCAWTALGPATRADDRHKAEHDKMNEAIKHNGKLPGSTYWHHAEMRYQGKKGTIAATPLNKMKAGVPVTPTRSKGSRLTMVKAESATVGDPPPGFGKGFTWDRADNEAMLVIFLNAADSLGISIEGVQAGDQVQFVAASGIASFSQDKGNPLASSIVALAAAGANVTLKELDAPEVKPLIDAAEQFAKDQFKATNAKTKRRDAFGVDPGSGGKAQQEGGVIVCMPEAGGTFYSGDSDHRGRWIQGDGVRSDDHLPTHIFGAFFPIQGSNDHNTRIAMQSAPMFLLAWDWAFDDNAGFYKVVVKLTKGNGPPPPPPILKKESSKPKAKPKL